MKRNQLWLVIALVAAAGCAQLPDVEGNVCGNGVLETGEDCEGPMLDENGTVIGQCGDPDGDNGCFFECVPGEDEVCPPGYGCGIDGRCRQPSGKLTSGASMTLVADSLSTGDVDGDGYADLIAASGTSIEIDFGSAQGDFSASVDNLVATPERGVQIGDLDRDGADDVLVGTTPGIQTFLGSADRALDPFSYPIALITPSADFALGAAVDVDAIIPDDEVVLAWGDQIGFAALSPTARMTLPDPTGPVDGTADNLLAPLSTARLDAQRNTGTPPETQDPTVEVALGYPATSEIFIVEASGNPLAISLQQTLAAGDPLDPGSGLFYGFWNADNCLDLIAHVGAASGRLVVFRNDCNGALQPPIELAPFALTDRLIGVADFDRDGITDLVTNRGVFRVTGTGPWTLTQIASAGGIPYKRAQVVDLNGDGALDLAAFRDAQPDVDALINAGDNVFNPFVIPTADPVQALAAGDFDGDLTPDIAMVELDSSGEVPVYAVSVSFGQFHGPPGARVVMDHFDLISGFVSASLVGATGEPDAVADLVVLEDDPAAGHLEASVLFGSGARSMNSPLTLQASGIETPDAFLVDQFDGQAGLDVFAIGHAGTAFLFSGDGNSGELDTTESAPWPTGTDVKDTASASGDVDGDGAAEIAVAERHSFGGAGSVHVMLFAADPSTIPADAVLAQIDGFVGVHVLRIEDLDGDGDQDLLVALDPLGDDIAGTLQIGFNSGGAIAGLSPVSGADGCIDAVPIDLDTEPTPELVGLCRDEGGGRDDFHLRRFDAAEADTPPIAGDPLVPTSGGRSTHLLAADVDGDGLTDVIVSTRGDQAASVHVFRQSGVHE